MFDITIEELMELNNITEIYPGQKLLVEKKSLI